MDGFFQARCGARHQEAGDVGTGHQQDENDKPAEKRWHGDESGFQAAAHFRADDGDVVFVAFGMLAFEGGHDDVHFGLGLRDGDAGMQAADHGEGAVGALL